MLGFIINAHFNRVGMSLLNTLVIVFYNIEIFNKCINKCKHYIIVFILSIQYRPDSMSAQCHTMQT